MPRTLIDVQVEMAEFVQETIPLYVSLTTSVGRGDKRPEEAVATVIATYQSLVKRIAVPDNSIVIDAVSDEICWGLRRAAGIQETVVSKLFNIRPFPGEENIDVAFLDRCDHIARSGIAGALKDLKIRSTNSNVWPAEDPAEDPAEHPAVRGANRMYRYTEGSLFVRSASVEPR